MPVAWASPVGLRDVSGAEWTMVSPRDPEWPVLPLDGRRSIHCAWPEGAFCDECGDRGISGYAGPVVGDRVFFPDRRLVFVCVPCALAQLGIDPDRFDAHRCGPGCSDRLHVDVVEADDALRAGPSAEQRAAAAAWRTADTPWAIVDVTPVSRSLAAALGWLAVQRDVSGLMALWMELAAPLDWSGVTEAARAQR